jgi:hypothetical protein
VTYDQLLALLLASESNDWLVNDRKGIFTFKLDLDVTLREVRRSEPQPFGEDWARAFPDRDAKRAEFELWFRGSYVKTYYFAAVDGGRALLPYPESATELTITAEQLAVAKAVNFSVMRSYFDDYIRRFNVRP